MTNGQLAIRSCPVIAKSAYPSRRFVTGVANTSTLVYTWRYARAPTEAAMSDDDAAQLAAGFQLLADPIRLRLLSLIATAAGGGLCACDLPEALNRAQPTISHHLKLLTQAGLVTREQRGKWAWYRASPERLGVLRDALA